MLSNMQTVSKLEEKKRMLSLPQLERPVTVRLKFRKVGSLQYISHLDLQRTFLRVIMRSCIPVWYTKGFNPHPKLVFSTPLSVGAQSEYEFLDIRMDRDLPPQEIMDRLNRELTEELCITEAYVPKNDFSEICWASYDLEICCHDLSSAVAEEMQKTLTTSPLLLVKKTKSGEKEVDIIPMIHSVSVTFNETAKTAKICATLKASSTEFLNPEMVITALKKKHGILCGDPTKEWYTILRRSIMKADMSLFD